jgi:AcrR family transcriptional regulator
MPTCQTANPTQGQETVPLPTGVPIHDVRAQLLDAAEHVLLRDGPSGLTSRAVTTEAGVAKGVLHRHFADFDTLLAGLVLTPLELLDARSAALRADAGSATVARNVAHALADTLTPTALAIISLVTSRHDLLARLRLTTPAGIPLLAETTTMIAAYLTAERGLGRIRLDADVDTLAVLLVGGAHLIAAGRESVPDSDALHQVVTAAIAAGSPRGEQATRQ